MSDIVQDPTLPSYSRSPRSQSRLHGSASRILPSGKRGSSFIFWVVSMFRNVWLTTHAQVTSDNVPGMHVRLGISACRLI